jgi:maleylacetoacetate isomerase
MAADSTIEPVLYSYWRSSSAYRVRIALNLKDIQYQQKFVHLVKDGGEQHRPEYRDINPLGLVPALVHGDLTIVQSLSICEYLEETFGGPSLLPPDPGGRARVRSITQSIASEIQPLNNLAVMQYLAEQMQQDSNAINGWYTHWVERGFSAVEAWLSADSGSKYCHGDSPGLADCFLVPQVYNAERFSCDLQPYPHIRQITAHCRSLPAFAAAEPENQPVAG